jgi:hypothetical protein
MVIVNDLIELKDLIGGKCEPYGLFHATHTSVDELDRVGLAPGYSPPVCSLPAQRFPPLFCR